MFVSKVCVILMKYCHYKAISILCLYGIYYKMNAFAIEHESQHFMGVEEGAVFCFSRELI